MTTLQTRLENLLTHAAAASQHVSALERLITLAGQAKAAQPMNGAEIAAVLEPLRLDLDAFFDRALGVLEAAQKEVQP